MWEILPLVGGLILGVTVARVRARGSRWPWDVGGSIVVGALATLGAGEGPVFLFVDVPLALIGAAVATFAYDRVTEPSRRLHGP